MSTQIKEKQTKKRISEVLAIVAMALLLTYIADAAIGQGRTGFLPISEAQRGAIFGGFSIVLFLAAFGIGWKEKSKTMAVLLIAGGAIMGTSVLGASAMTEGGLAGISGSFLGVIILGYIIMGLGIWKMAR